MIGVLRTRMQMMCDRDFEMCDVVNVVVWKLPLIVEF